MNTDAHGIEFIENLDPAAALAQTESPAEAPLVKAPPISSRFLFVDVAAQRAKQLRRGARPRVPVPGEGPVKLERIAMDEVRGCLVDYTLPAARIAAGEGAM
jgi:DNA-directed RNA polymerase subunit K/omega